MIEVMSIKKKSASFYDYSKAVFFFFKFEG